VLPINFHKTFIPERRLITALLDFAAQKKEGTLQEISLETGIPMGQSTGKTPAIIDYARGMGLITIEKGEKQASKKPMLTDFGIIVYREDKYLSEEMVQWLVHMNLCRSDIGALAWHRVFAVGRNVLGTAFTKQQLEEYLISSCGPGKDRTGPLILTYTEDAALARAGILNVKGEEVLRRKAPSHVSYALPYSAFIIMLMEVFFPRQTQVTLTDFNKTTRWFDICLWNQPDVENILAQVELKNYLSIDRQMHPWIIEKKAPAKEVWLHIFDDMA
jgi:hypothetical protein